MSDALFTGADRIAERVRQRAADARVALVTLFWNGDEGLQENAELQTLFIEGAQKTARVALTSGQVSSAAEGGVSHDVDALIEEALNNIHVPAPPIPPEGGAG